MSRREREESKKRHTINLLVVPWLHLGGPELHHGGQEDDGDVDFLYSF